MPKILCDLAALRRAADRYRSVMFRIRYEGWIHSWNADEFQESSAAILDAVGIPDAYGPHEVFLRRELLRLNEHATDQELAALVDKFHAWSELEPLDRLNLAAAIGVGEEKFDCALARIRGRAGAHS